MATASRQEQGLCACRHQRSTDPTEGTAARCGCQGGGGWPTPRLPAQPAGQPSRKLTLVHGHAILAAAREALRGTSRVRASELAEEAGEAAVGPLLAFHQAALQPVSRATSEPGLPCGRPHRTCKRGAAREQPSASARVQRWGRAEAVRHPGPGAGAWAPTNRLQCRPGIR